MATSIIPSLWLWGSLILKSPAEIMDMAVTYPLECAPGSNLRFKRAIPELFSRLATFVDSISVSKTHLIVSSFIYGVLISCERLLPLAY